MVPYKHFSEAVKLLKKKRLLLVHSNKEKQTKKSPKFELAQITLLGFQYILLLHFSISYYQIHAKNIY